MAIKEQVAVNITAPNMPRLALYIKGSTPYVQNKFSGRSTAAIRTKQEAGSTATKNKSRASRDFNADFLAAQHRDERGAPGIPASAFRAAAIRACKLCGFEMTMAKLTLFVIADSLDAETGEGLVRLNEEPELNMSTVRNATGVIDLRARPMWRQWSARVVVEYDADQFTKMDVINLFLRIGKQVGVGEGRPDSKKSAGMGWGLFELGKVE